MSEPLPTVEDIEDELDRQRLSRLAQWLRDHGYTALRNEECGCSVEDLAPCSDGPFEDCHAAFWVRCLRGDTYRCDDCDITFGHCARDVNEPCAPPPQEVSE